MTASTTTTRTARPKTTTPSTKRSTGSSVPSADAELIAAAIRQVGERIAAAIEAAVDEPEPDDGWAY